MTADFWNESRIDRLWDLADKGYSASLIGAEIGCTKNAVIGKSYRLGVRLAARIRIGMPERPAATADAVAMIADAVAPAPPAPPAPPSSRPRPSARPNRSPPPQKPKRPPPMQRSPESAIPFKDRMGAPRAVLALQANQCRWPVGDPRQADFHFCSEPADPDDRPRYCARHKEAHGAEAAWRVKRAAEIAARLLQSQMKQGRSSSAGV